MSPIQVWRSSTGRPTLATGSRLLVLCAVFIAMAVAALLTPLIFSFLFDVLRHGVKVCWEEDETQVNLN
jgi:hypothetical protein